MWVVTGGWGPCPGVGGATVGPLEAHDTCERSRDPWDALSGCEVAREVWESQLCEVYRWLICAWDTKD